MTKVSTEALMGLRRAVLRYCACALSGDTAGQRAVLLEVPWVELSWLEEEEALAEEALVLSTSISDIAKTFNVHNATIYRLRNKEKSHLEICMK